MVSSLHRWNVSLSEGFASTTIISRSSASWIKSKIAYISHQDPAGDRNHTSCLNGDNLKELNRHKVKYITKSKKRTRRWHRGSDVKKQPSQLRSPMEMTLRLLRRGPCGQCWLMSLSSKRALSACSHD